MLIKNNTQKLIDEIFGVGYKIAEGKEPILRDAITLYAETINSRFAEVLEKRFYSYPNKLATYREISKTLVNKQTGNLGVTQEIVRQNLCKILRYLRREGIINYIKTYLEEVED